MKKILWLSGHNMNGIQMSALQRMFGADVQLVEQIGHIGNAEQVVSAYRQGGFDDLIIIAPMSVIAKIVEQKVYPLWSEAVICSREQADWETNGRYYRFARFRRIRKLAFEFDDLGPAAMRQATDTVGGQPPQATRRHQAATIPADVMREQRRGGFSPDVMEKIYKIAQETEALELLYLKPNQRDRGGDQIHPNARVYVIPGRVQTLAGEKLWYYGEVRPEGQELFGGRLIVDPGSLSQEETVARVVSHLATVEFEVGMVRKLRCDEGPHRGAHLGKVQFGQKSEDRLVAADGKIIGWGIMPFPTRSPGSWTGLVELRLFHEPYPSAKMIKL